MATAEWQHSSCVTMDAAADLGLLRYIKISKRLPEVKEEPEKPPALQQVREVDAPSLSQRRLSGYFVSSESFPNVNLSRRRSTFEGGGFAKAPKIVGNSCTLHAKDTMQKRRDLDSDEERRTTLPPLVKNPRKKRQSSNGCPRLLGWPRYRRGRSNRVEKPQYSFRIKSGVSTSTEEPRVSVDSSVDDEKSPSVIDVSVDMLTKEETVVDKGKATVTHGPQTLPKPPTQRRTSLPKIENGITKATMHQKFSFDILPREKLPSPDLGAQGPAAKTGKTPPVVQRNLHIRLPDIYERQKTVHCRHPSEFGSWQVSREEDED
ncbi:hypothetical protein Bbelb_208090 [Branchiostoma belcheri]|nr:hypothetical protein Bbelb_208090 [Branchiostoma belcheri]